jgi:hypothetical protein
MASGRPGSLIAAAILVGIAPLAAVQAAQAAEVRHFQITLISSGHYAADYFDDRLAPGLTTAAGVDGRESRSWRWELRALGRSPGGGDVTLTSAVYRAATRYDGDLVSYSILMGKLGETRLGCATNTVRRSWDGRGAGPPPTGDLVRYGRRGTTLVQDRQFVFFFAPFAFGDSVGCGYHGTVEVRDFDSVGRTAPARAFTQAPGRSLSRTFRRLVVEPPETADPNQLHTFSGRTALTIRIRRISAERWRDLSRKLAGAPPSRTAAEPLAGPAP